MSKQQGGSFHVPLPIIILGYIISTPVGVVLTLLSLFGGKTDSKTTSGSIREEKTGSNGQDLSGSTKTDTGAKKKDNTTRRNGFSVPALILNILAGIFLFCAVLNTAEGLFSLPMQEFLHGDYISEAVMMLLFSGGCFIPAQIFRKSHERRNVIRSIIGRRESMNLTQLAAASDLSMKKLRKELQSMIDKGEFGDEAYLDLSSGRFMRHPDELEEKFRMEAEKTAAESTNDGDPDSFRSIILQIRRLNDDIKDYAVSERIYRIEEHTQNIFDYVTEHPEAMNQIRTFMNYYLPTTLKLLSSYSRIEQVGVAGENMKKSKENIERILDMLVVGFEQQVDQLFRNESMDISSEITVLEAMMKQDGLDGKNDFDLDCDPGFTDGFTDDLSGGSAAAQNKPQ